MPFTITYSSNGGYGGSAPVDPHGPYNPGETVPIQVPGSMTKSGAKCAYWNTKSDGSGMFYGWPLWGGGRGTVVKGTITLPRVVEHARHTIEKPSALAKGLSTS